ncbi:Integrator complex subunit 7 [Lunasporangiospora selenospora]|uniref:Integrator complex subunit 7 n=1 Tax=Lunasporangiospora selenospora TaxID=979761 RepID=A0A9P6G3E0_9FUNG|nr:Integrator complex subunit 7 [Lunasporangiospora selenospora]
MTRAASDEAGFKRLVELETEYRTQRAADQLRAIASFPRLFDEFPFPVIINAAVLKLADYFRNSNNIQRHAILQVFKSSQHHLDKVLNVEETTKRISPMMQSNDPLARAITLRLLGCMSTIIYDRIDVYHNIIHSLDSSEAMEASAAVYAADRICAQSQKFCAIISGKLAFMVRDEKTPLPLRRRLIRIFGHMFEDITLARLARKTCLDILDLNQDGEYTVAILKTLTRLASHSLVDVTQQIDLLVLKAQSHESSGIRRVSMMCLGLLADNGIKFEQEHVKVLFKITHEAKDEGETRKAMSVLNKIFTRTSMLSSILLDNDRTATVNELLRAGLQVLSLSQSSLGKQECFEFFAAVLPFLVENRDVLPQDLRFPEAVTVVTTTMEQFLVETWSSQQGNQTTLQERRAQSGAVLSQLVVLALTCDEDKRVTDLIARLVEWLRLFENQADILAKALLKVARLRPTLFQGLQEPILAYLEHRLNNTNTKPFVQVFKVIIEAASVYRLTASPTAFNPEQLEVSLSTLLEQFGDFDIRERYTKNHWELYQLARHALQSGWPAVAVAALRNLEKPVKSVPCVLWLSSLQIMSTVERSLQSGQQQCALGEARPEVNATATDLYPQMRQYAQVVDHLHEMEAYQVDRSFHLQICIMRREYLQACQHAITSLHFTSSSILTRQRLQAGPAGLDALRPLTVATDEVLLIQCANNFSQLAHRYTLLKAKLSTSLSNPANITMSGSPLESLYNMDQQTDMAIGVLQTMCLALAYAIQSAATLLASSATYSQSQSMQSKVEIFDIDSLLIPLLSQAEDLTSRSDGARSSESIFNDSWRRALGYLNEQLHGEDSDSLQRSISTVQEFVSQCISYPVPFPHEFFLSRDILHCS